LPLFTFAASASLIPWDCVVFFRINLSCTHAPLILKTWFGHSTGYKLPSPLLLRRFSPFYPLLLGIFPAVRRHQRQYFRFLCTCWFGHHSKS
jgi:hypothetical protein